MLEDRIAELVGAIDRLTSVLTKQDGEAVPPSTPPKTPEARPRKKAAAALESAQPAATPAVTAASVAAPPAQSPAAPSPTAPDTKVQLAMVNAIIRLANEYDHETAVAILGKRNVKRCAEVPAGEWQAVLDEAEEAIAKAQAATATASLV